MPVKDVIHVFQCKFCNEKFTMFDHPDGGLIYFPANVMWPIHGEFALVDHFRNCHRHNYELHKLFYGTDHGVLISKIYRRVENEPDKERLCV